MSRKTPDIGIRPDDLKESLSKRHTSDQAVRTQRRQRRRRRPLRRHQEIRLTTRQEK